MMAEETIQLTQQRDRSIRLALITSFVSKFGTVLLQLLAVPIAIRVLGREEFGIYTMVNLTLSSLTLLQVGVGPALTHGLTQARAAEDATRQRELASSAFFLMLGIALLATSLLACVLLLLPLPTLFGNEFAGKEAMMRPALWIGLGLFFALFILNLTERIREGHLQVFTNNLWGAAGNVLAALLVGIGISYWPHVWFLVIAMHGSMVLCKLGNTAALWHSYRLMRPSLGMFRMQKARGLFTDGLAFSTCCLITGVVEFNLCGWLIGRLDGPESVALYGIFITLTVMQLGFVVMLSAPTWPAVAEALARNDYGWASRAAKRLYLFGSGFAICSATGLVLLGPWLLGLWLGKEFSNLPRLLLLAYGLYFCAHVWRHINHMMMIGTGQVSRLVRIQLFESAMIAALIVPAMHIGGIPGVFIMMAACSILCTGTFLPKQVWKKLKPCVV